MAYDVNGPRLKVGQADRHIEALRQELIKFMDREPFAIYAERGNGRLVIGVEVRELLPESIPLLIGDAIHNLRSALDLLAGCLVHRGGGNPIRAKFPFGSGQAFEDALKQIKKAGPDVIDAIRQFRSPQIEDDILSQLHALDIIDKHRLILTTIQSAKGNIQLSGSGTISVGGFIIANALGRHLRMQVPGNMTAEIRDHVFVLSIADSPAFKEMDALDALAKIRDKVSTAIDELWALLPPIR